jgi:fucose 4-O-acetylase-like acetyltransferase
MKAESGGDRFEWVLIAKGIGIFLVVVGHFHPEFSPIYWSEIKKIIISFDMPLFLILSGYLYSHGKYSYNNLIKIKAKRLLCPFVSIGVAFFLIKYVAGYLVSLEYPVNIRSIYALLIDPVNSYMPLLWFVHTLFLIFAIYPLARLFLNNIAILLLLIVLNAVLGSDYVVFGKTLANMPFFVAGVILRENGKLSSMAMRADRRYPFVLLVMFFLVYTIQLSVNIVLVAGYPVRLFLGVIGSLFVINMSHTISSLSNGKIKGALLQIGFYSMTIYLFHTLFESTIRIAFLQVFKHMGAPFELIAFIAITCGVVLPLVVEKGILRKHWVTKKFVLGLP